MTRHRRHDVVVFDLDGTGTPPGPTEAGVGRPGSELATAGPDEAATRSPGRSRAQRLRESIMAGAVVVILLAAWGVTNAAHEHQRLTRLAGAPGGVLSLAHAPVARWSAGTDSADTTAFMPGLVVVRRGTVLHGLDAATGADRWQVDVSGDPVCGLSAWGSGTMAAVDPLVCWSGPNAASSTVTVIHANGSSSTRALDGPVDGAAGTADGGLVTARRIGPKPPSGGVAITLMDGGGYTVSGSLAHGQDAVVRLEDAATGALRWERTVPFLPVADVTTCGSLTVNRGNDGPTVDVTSLSFTTYPSFVELHACGLDAGFTLAGAATTARDTSGGSSAQPYVDGGVLEQMGVASGGTVGSVLHGADGAVVGTYPGQVLQPRATDGTSSDLVLTGSGGVPLQALARDGSVRWKSTHTYAEVLVRTAGGIVAQRNDLAISGLDPATGAVLWTDDGLLTGDPTTGTHDDVKAAFTDGSVALLVIANEGGTATALVALDLASGEVRWRSTVDGFWPLLTAVDGRLVQIVGNQGSGYQDDGRGGSLRLDPGTVTALG